MRKLVGVVFIAIIGLNLLGNWKTVALQCNCCNGFKFGMRRDAEEASNQNSAQVTTETISEATTLKDPAEEARLPSTDPSPQKSNAQDKDESKATDASHCTTNCDKPETCQGVDVKFCYSRFASHHSGTGTTWGCSTEERMREYKAKCEEIKAHGQCEMNSCETDKCNTAETAPSPSGGRNKSGRPYFSWVLFATALCCVVQIF